MTSDNSMMLSQPIHLIWNGWESNTFDLQRNGWELSVSEDISRMRMTIALRHKESHMMGMSGTFDFDYMADQIINRSGYGYNNTSTTDQNCPTFECKLASDFIIRVHDTSLSAREFQPIDARPMYVDNLTISELGLDQFAHFRKIETGENEIFLKRASMDDILNMALSKQEPKQEQIRKEMVRRNEFDVMRKSQLKANLRLVG